jgi:PAS domain S-box-containing protein
MADTRVTDRFLAENMQELYERAPCGYVLTYPDGVFARVNETFLTWTGLSRDDLIGTRKFQDLLTLPGKIFYENQYFPLLRMQGSTGEIAFDLLRSSAEPLRVLVSSQQRHGPDGEPLVIASVVFDATQRRAYERELLLMRREAEQLAAVVRLSSDAILTTSVTGEIVSCNTGGADLLGYRSGEPSASRGRPPDRRFGGRYAVPGCTRRVHGGWFHHAGHQPPTRG